MAKTRERTSVRLARAFEAQREKARAKKAHMEKVKVAIETAEKGFRLALLRQDLDDAFFGVPELEGYWA